MQATPPNFHFNGKYIGGTHEEAGNSHGVINLVDVLLMP